MTEDPTKRELTGDQIIYLYQRQLNYAVLWVLLSGFVGAIIAIVLLFFVEGLAWARYTGAAVAILGGGMVQRLFVLRVKCPACGGRALGRIHSIVQARNVHECPYCDAKLRD